MDRRSLPLAVLGGLAFWACEERGEPTTESAFTTDLLASESAAATGDEPVLGPTVDLLHAVPTEVRVSSAYRDEAEQPERIADGDLETAWNSASGDLAGAWVEVTLPESARIDELRLTAGYAKRTERRDLFTGNHRIERVRVTHDGEIVAERALNHDERGLQAVPIGRAGGRYRIEITAVREGSRSDWREVCISELQVMGRAPSARPGTVTPEFSVGERSESAQRAPGEAGLDAWGAAELSESGAE